VSDSEIYACHRCGVVDIKLWREYQTFSVRLTCVDCLAALLVEEADERAFHPEDVAEDGTLASAVTGERTDQIGWWVPAVLDSEMLPELVFWGYSSARLSDYERWQELPLRRSEGDEGADA
jgi:hypothetical protein